MRLARFIWLVLSWQEHALMDEVETRALNFRPVSAGRRSN